MSHRNCCMQCFLQPFILRIRNGRRIFAFVWPFILTQMFVATPSWGSGTLHGCIRALIEYAYNQL